MFCSPRLLAGLATFSAIACSTPAAAPVGNGNTVGYGNTVTDTDGGADTAGQDTGTGNAAAQVDSEGGGLDGGAPDAEKLDSVAKSKQLDNLAEKDKWVQLKFDLGKHIGKKIQIRFRFDSSDDFKNDAPGWFIDDLAVTMK